MYDVLYLYISAPLYEASCSKCSEKYAAGSRHRSKAYVLYALLLSRHPCRLWLGCAQSTKNNYASPKSCEMYKYNMSYTVKLGQTSCHINLSKLKRYYATLYFIMVKLISGDYTLLLFITAQSAVCQEKKIKS